MPQHSLIVNEIYGSCSQEFKLKKKKVGPFAGQIAAKFTPTKMFLKEKYKFFIATTVTLIPPLCKV
jgi:hypothetical protein